MPSFRCTFLKIELSALVSKITLHIKFAGSLIHPHYTLLERIKGNEGKAGMNLLTNASSLAGDDARHLRHIFVYLQCGCTVAASKRT